MMPRWPASPQRRAAVGCWCVRRPQRIWKHTVDCLSILPVPLFTSAGQAVANAEAHSVAGRAGLDPWVVRSAVQQSAAANRFMERDADALLGGDDLTSYALGRCDDQLRIALSLGGRARGSTGARRTHCRALCPGLAAVRQPRPGAPRRATHRRPRAGRFHSKIAYRELLIEAPLNVLMLVRCAPG